MALIFPKNIGNYLVLCTYYGKHLGFPEYYAKEKWKILNIR